MQRLPVLCDGASRNDNALLAENLGDFAVGQRLLRILRGHDFGIDLQFGNYR